MADDAVRDPPKRSLPGGGEAPGDGLLEIGRDGESDDVPVERFSGLEMVAQLWYDEPELIAGQVALHEIHEVAARHQARLARDDMIEREVHGVFSVLFFERKAGVGAHEPVPDIVPGFDEGLPDGQDGLVVGGHVGYVTAAGAINAMGARGHVADDAGHGGTGGIRMGL